MRNSHFHKEMLSLLQLLMYVALPLQYLLRGKLSTDRDFCCIGQPDGWWQGQRVGDNGNSKLFPSKSVPLSLSILSLRASSLCTD